jgi:hypothetical protein
LQGTEGSNSWYVSDVTVSFTVTDDSDVTTQYSFDGFTFITYTAPFVITTEGKTMVQYRSIDAANNIEVPLQIIFTSIDKAPPVITITSPADGAELELGQEVVAEYSAVDTVSGTESVTGTVPNGGIIDTAATGPLTFTVTATDFAGNSASTTTSSVIIMPEDVTVKVTIVPGVINIASKGTFIAFGKLPTGYNASDIDKTTVTCNGAVAKRVMTMKKSPQVFGAFFRVSELEGVSPGDEVTLTVSGYLEAEGNLFRFEGSDTARIIQKHGNCRDESEGWDRGRDEDLLMRYYRDR